MLPTTAWLTISVPAGVPSSTRSSNVRVASAPGEIVPLHTHTVQEVLTFISGEGIATLGAETIPVCADMSLVVPPGTPHGYRNTGAEPLRLVITLADPDARLGKLVEANPAPSA